jgi:nicotinamidase-related amidase
MSAALLLIDFQRDFGAPDGAMARQGHDVTACQAALATAMRLADAARKAGVPVVFVRLMGKPGDPLCAAGTPGADFIGPQPLAGERIVSKALFSAFHDTGLAGTLRDADVDSLVLAGLTTECCVAASAWAAFEHGFAVAIATDACAAYEPGLHDGALEALKRSGATLQKVAVLTASWK